MPRCVECWRSSGYSNIYTSLKEVSSGAVPLYNDTNLIAGSHLWKIQPDICSAIYHQLPEGNKWADHHDEGTGGGSLRYNDLFAIVFCRSTVDLNSVLVTFSPGLPNHFNNFTWKCLVFLGLDGLCSFFTFSKYVVECASEIQILEND